MTGCSFCIGGKEVHFMNAVYWINRPAGPRYVVDIVWLD
jgi:hypothetical protein